MGEAKPCFTPNSPATLSSLLPVATSFISTRTLDTAQAWMTENPPVIDRSTSIIQNSISAPEIVLGAMGVVVGIVGVTIAFLQLRKMQERIREETHARVDKVYYELA